MEICELKKDDEKAWDEYVLVHPKSTIYHQTIWKRVVENSYNHKSHYLIAMENGEIKGVLPLFLMKSFFFGRKLVSVPFAPYGGAIGENIMTENLLIDRAIEITENAGAKYLELRNNVHTESKLAIDTRYITLILKLDKNADVVWKGFNNKIRNAIRKSLNSELTISNGSVEEFYGLYSKNMRDLGTPTHSKEFFNSVIMEFKENAEILVVKKNNVPISAAILLYFKDIVISGWAASDREYRNFSPNNLLYWHAIKTACEKGYKSFDFGRSIVGTGTYNFKMPWGAQPNQLYYNYYLNSSNKLIPNTSTLNNKRKIFTGIYKKVPLAVANLVGPVLRRNFA